MSYNTLPEIKDEHDDVTLRDFEKRVWCGECGYSYSPAHDDVTFGPKYCPRCGNHRGSMPSARTLRKRGWEDEVVRPVRCREPANSFAQLLLPFLRRYTTYYVGRDGNVIDPADEDE